MSASEQVRIEREVYGGSGLARLASGAVVFVPFTLTGELVEIEAPAKRNEATLLRVVEAADARTPPPCQHFGRCGGCHYQHAEYSAQLAIKRSILLETMARAGVHGLPELTTHSSEPWQYRNRVRFRLDHVNGELRMCYSVRGTNEFLPIVTCPIAAPLLFQAAETLLQLCGEHPEVRTFMEAAREVEFFISDDASQFQMTMFMVTKLPPQKSSFRRVCDLLKSKLPDLSGASIVPSQSASQASRVAMESWGAAGLLYRTAGEGYWISRGGFFQVNRFLTEALVELVCDSRKGTVAWDLYAGVGLFSRVLARSFTQVTAVEANPAAYGDLQAAMAKLGPKHRAVQASTLSFLQRAAVQRERPELVVLDPPRAGAGVEACRLLMRLKPAEMVYVSCDPTTLARDLAVLQASYRIAEMHLVDLFPQTFHMETVVVLQAR